MDDTKGIVPGLSKYQHYQWPTVTLKVTSATHRPSITILQTIVANCHTPSNLKMQIFYMTHARSVAHPLCGSRNSCYVQTQSSQVQRQVSGRTFVVGRRTWHLVKFVGRCRCSQLLLNTTQTNHNINITLKK